MTVLLTVLGGIGALAVLLLLANRRFAASIGELYPPTGRFVRVGRSLVHVIDRPAAPENAGRLPVLVFHGASGNARDPALAFEPATGSRRFLFVDRPGHGWSTREGVADAAPAAQAARAAGLLDALKIEKAVVVGISLGGAVAAAFALHHGQKTAAVVFVAPATHPWPGGVDWYYRLAAAPVLGWLFTRIVVPPVAALMAPRSVTAVFAPDPAPSGYQEATGVDLLFRPATFRANGEDVAWLLRHVEEMSPRYAEIAAPVEIVTGDSDPVVWAHLHSEGLARDIPGARLTWLPGVGHMPHHVATATVVAAIDRAAARAGEATTAPLPA